MENIGDKIASVLESKVSRRSLIKAGVAGAVLYFFNCSSYNNPASEYFSSLSVVLAERTTKYDRRGAKERLPNGSDYPLPNLHIDNFLKENYDFNQKTQAYENKKNPNGNVPKIEELVRKKEDLFWSLNNIVQKETEELRELENYFSTINYNKEKADQYEVWIDATEQTAKFIKEFNRLFNSNSGYDRVASSFMNKIKQHRKNLSDIKQKKDYNV